MWLEPDRERQSKLNLNDFKIGDWVIWCNIEGKRMSRLQQLKSYLKQNDTISTKEVGKLFRIATPKAYRLCRLAEQEGWLIKYGYKVKEGQW